MATDPARKVYTAAELADAEPCRLSNAALEARTPPRPEDLVGALQDRIHPSSGRLRAARSVNRHRFYAALTAPADPTGGQ